MDRETACMFWMAEFLGETENNWWYDLCWHHADKHRVHPSEIANATNQAAEAEDCE